MADSETPGCTPATRRGRERAARILDAAAGVFLERGFEAATMSEIGRRAGGSMQTLYRLFGSKEALFRAIMERKAGSVYAPLEDESIFEQPPERALFELGMRLNRLLLDPDTLRTHRAMIIESHRNANLRQIFYETGPGRARAALARYFRVECERGHLRLDDPDAAARQFLDFVKGAHYLEAVLGQPVTATEAEIERCVDEAVRIFLDGARGVAPDQPPR
ncbi:hypothetical protein KBTX_02657 [wastewater metagenome]|uniref:HTH tetR-type domain-containing protein n=2 Tax=unclassified sequences TaxID=12908 RepID=A0A5B8RHD8_9ZZZZ|nr:MULTISPECIES: TetR/AcrR family transcriptional regulator [Arhodomonas]MCS4505417.1 TetR/AcrR family transcriptional regulator [Arhodomonas aquaeolei]QEA06325.1 hypothetical protein KBTEX_02657 [uncultured organism]